MFNAQKEKKKLTITTSDWNNDHNLSLNVIELFSMWRNEAGERERENGFEQILHIVKFAKWCVVIV